jgi:hypothetical protein
MLGAEAGGRAPSLVQPDMDWCPAVFPHRERHFRSVLDLKPVIACGQPVAQAATRISDEHDLVLTTHAGDGHRRGSKTSVVAARCIELKLQASTRLHAISV